MNDKITEKILLIAKNEFLNNGFSNASMRAISAKAGLTTGSLYSRFKDKDELFGAIVEDKAHELVDIFNSVQQEFASLSVQYQAMNLRGFVNGKMTIMLDFIYDNFEIFKLLICKSEGSKYEDYVESFVEIEQRNTSRYINDLSLGGIKLNDVSFDFNHIIASSLFNGFFQIVEHDYSKEEGIKYVSILYHFFEAGWNEILKKK